MIFFYFYTVLFIFQTCIAARPKILLTKTLKNSFIPNNQFVASLKGGFSQEKRVI